MKLGMPIPQQIVFCLFCSYAKRAPFVHTVIVGHGELFCNVTDSSHFVFTSVAGKVCHCHTV